MESAKANGTEVGRDASLPDGRALHAVLRRVIAEVREIDLSRYETAPLKLVTDQGVPRIRDLVERSIAVLDRVLARYEDERQHQDVPAPDRSGGFFAAVDILMEREDLLQGLVDLAFMARMELAGRRRALDHAAALVDRWSVVARCGSACRRVLKAMTAVDRALCQLEGLWEPVDEGFVTELTNALACRRAYATFRKAIHSRGEPEPGGVESTLRFALAQLDRLCGGGLYAEFRILDRKQIRGFQSSIRNWLADDTRTNRAGLELWSDLHGFASLLDGINQRALLQEHDHARFTSFHTALTTNMEEVTYPDAWLAWMDSLHVTWGRDEELDALIERSDESEAEAWRSVLERVVRGLRPEAAPEHVPDDISEVIVEIDRRRDTMRPGDFPDISLT